MEHIGNYVYHVTLKKNLKSIMKRGILPSVPEDMLDQKGVYVFTTPEDAEDSLMNWLGDRFDEEDDIVLIKIDSDKVKLHDTEAGYEKVSYDIIQPSSIVSYTNL